MKVSELKKSLHKVCIKLNYNTDLSFEELTIAIDTTLPELNKGGRKLVLAAFIGLSIGRKIGFQEGIDHIFNYTPEEQ